VFILVWVFHIIATILLLVGIWWAMKDGDYYVSFPFVAIPSMLFLYAVYWIVILLIKLYHK
jgi:hypothetical protein